MQILNQSVDLDSFFEHLQKGTHPNLILDYDGTLAPFRKERSEAVPYVGVREILQKICDRTNTRMTIVSGRPAREVKEMISLDRPIEIWGEHGGERLDIDGRLSATELPEEASDGFALIVRWAETEGIDKLVEKKKFSRAFHFRGIDQPVAASLAAKIRDRWQSELPPLGLELCQFDGGLEARYAAVSKRLAVRKIVGKGTALAAAAYLGDDETDEDAFAALPETGLKVLVRPELKPTCADIWLIPPEELLAFLERWLKSSGG